MIVPRWYARAAGCWGLGLGVGENRVGLETGVGGGGRCAHAMASWLVVQAGAGACGVGFGCLHRGALELYPILWAAQGGWRA